MRALEKRIKAADAVQFSAEVFEFDKEKPRSKFSVLFTKSNQARLKETTTVAFSYTWELISDGKRMKLGAVSSDSKNPIPIEKRQEEDTPTNLHDRICMKLASPGIGLAKLSGADSDYSWWRKEIKIGPGDKLYKLEGFKMSAPEKVAGRDAKVIKFTVEPGTPVTLWIDAETLLPLQSIQGTWGKGNAGTKEVYSEFKLNPKIEDKSFDLPK